MTDKEKLNKIKELADKMCKSAEYLQSDASHLHRAVYEYQQFIIQYWNDEEPVSKDLEEAAIYNQLRCIFDEKINETTLGELKYVGERNFKDGAQWQKQQIIDKACDWLKEHLWEYDQYSCIPIDVDEIVKDFKQAMEG